MKKSYYLVPVLIVISFFLASCATPVKEAELIPLEEEDFQSTGKSIIVEPVSLAKRPQPGLMDPANMTFPEADAYRFAVTNTLSKSGLFTEVKAEGAADYTLSTDVIGERMLGSMSNVVFILIRYKLVDSSTQKILWEENIFSHFELSADEEFIGATRIGKALEGAVRSNMNQLDDRLAEELNAQGT